MAEWDRQFALEQLKGKDLSNYSFYEFGIYTGSSFRFIYNLSEKLNLNPNCIYGFDSFQGLPKEKENLPIAPGWEEGYFRIDESDILERIKSSVSGKIPFELIKGFFKDSLNQEFLNKSPKKAVFIDIDCDLFISTYQVFEFMLDNDLIEKGCLISFDDWGGMVDKGGESLAFKDICEKYNLQHKELASFGDANPHMQKVFQIL